MNKWREVLLTIGLVASGLVMFAGISIIWPLKAQTNLGPFETDLSIGNTASMNAVPANPTRRAVIICNDHASQTINVTFGTASTPSATVGLRIPGGNAVASCWYSSSASTGGGQGAQINFFASGATTPVTVFEY